jgi:hypothetical protein
MKLNKLYNTKPITSASNSELIFLSFANFSHPYEELHAAPYAQDKSHDGLNQLEICQGYALSVSELFLRAHNHDFMA